MPDRPWTSLPLTPGERRLVQQVLEHFANALTQRLEAQGISRRLLVRTSGEVLREMFGAGGSVVDTRELLE